MDEQARNNEIWRAALTGDDPKLIRSRRVFGMIPANPRCKMCNAPFKGPGGIVMRMSGRGRGKFNPNVCTQCEVLARKHPGGAEIPLSFLFADIRGSTTLAETLGTDQFSRLIARFYNAATHALVKRDALIDRLLGDEVVALFLPAMTGQHHAEVAIRAAHDILEATGHFEEGGPWVPVGAGVHTGMAFVGAVGSNGVSDFTALGDNVNLTARLASAASAGEILITEAARSAAGIAAEGLESRRLDVKGKKEPVDVWVMRTGTAATQPEGEARTPVDTLRG